MSRKTVVGLTMVLALALTGCSGKTSGRSGKGGAPRTTAASPSSATATTSASSSVDAMSDVCQTVDDAAYNQLLAEALAVGDTGKDNSVLRAEVAETYRNFADRLTSITPLAPGKLGPALTHWASTSTAVAHYVAGNKPRAGLVLDYGPTQKPWNSAQKSAEKICGHELPDLDK